jgi:hypothetical protein
MEGVHISGTFEQCPRFAGTKKAINNNPPEFLQNNKELTLVRYNNNNKSESTETTLWLQFR